jgi:hypothetical protein
MIRITGRQGRFEPFGDASMRHFFYNIALLIYTAAVALG